MGPSAAGKSTLIKPWIGFERPTRGGVTVAGIDPWKERSGGLAVTGYVPQAPALEGGRTGAGLRPRRCDGGGVHDQE